ncbi:molybdopterin-guanine dinucleotide biosynthesis protein B [Aneurinibacillus aneurinilyticus]|uniref:Molybdopterin-guanine dinucleotide biosynthesis protein B n=2 Tax=Aneurinibacillus aneurinilyticus TaxID=1391 RepID=A0A848D4Y5_ANEAE|nr:molybdopterin-guanine dinucleotide biosynthesis protein B [Aneurinibacillus aneurinilyticus]ERI09827.1 molybdopterin-guanine dinucleotide biosynthesis protein B [Aneurinibacillus aneurinilyticus ATCC 12856]MED0672856.1 molybdopterin-guanine dinucleotide biosynthesis protein B [Aneurinibacillus aneurinilyticus]MED0708017.1 molybdopterin-guanine dinucleotide biosynthesis protein B [Aneurinibacillus aneurinilyticus]MED0722180.1 molybdopterin-guanine dinucleotide biosynthesis protein B [Aneurini
MSQEDRHPPVLQVVGYSNSGKTTLITKLLVYLSAQGYRIGTIKHDAHDFEVDKPGKDTWRHREAGASLVSITSAQKTAIMIQEYRTIEELLPLYKDMDIVLIEGYKFADYPKIVVLRHSEHVELMENVTSVLAVATWERLEKIGHPQYDVNDIEGIAGILLAHLKGETQ